MINRLQIENFKSWRDTGDLRFAPLTGFFGSNSSGKTGLIQLLLALKQTVESPDRTQALHLGDDRDDRSYVELGTFRDILFQRDLDKILSWTLGWRTDKPLQVQDPESSAKLFKSRDIAFHAELQARPEGRFAVESLHYILGGDRFGFARGDKGYELFYRGSTSFGFVRSVGRPWPIRAPVKCYGFPDQVRAKYQNAGFLSDLELAFEELFQRVYYLGPLRDYPHRRYSWSGAEPPDMGRRGERAVDALLASRQSGVQISRGRGRPRFTVEQYVAWWLRELDLIHEFRVGEISEGSNLYQVKVRKTKTGPEVLLTDVGFGVSQILPVLVLCYYAPEGSTLILEQPEIHLHPSVQAGLADVFIDAIQTRKVQILLESHSEYLLKRLQRRIAETEGQYDQFTHDDVALYFCSMKRGESRAEPLDVDEVGNITNWPQDFFGDEMADLAARTRAAARRKKALAG